MSGGAGIDEDRAAATASARHVIGTALRRRRSPMMFAVLGAAGHTATLLAIPQVTQRAVDALVKGRPADHFTVYAELLVAIGLARAVLGGVRKYQATKLMASVGADIRTDAFDVLQRLSFSFHDRLGTGQLMARASSDVTAVENFVAMVPFVLQTVAVAIGACVLLVAIHPPLAMAVVAAIVLMGTVTLRQAGPLRPRSRLLQESLGRFTQFVEQQVGGIRVVKGHGFEDVNRVEGAGRAEEIADAGVRLAFARAKFVMLFMLTPASASLAVVGIGSWLATKGSLTAGELFAFLQYMGLLMSPVQVGVQVVLVWPQAVAASVRIDEVLSAQPDVRPPARPVPLPDGPGRVQFEAVEFGYRPERPVLNRVTLDIPGGTSVALVGASGGGKSTLASLVPRFYDPWHGRVVLDGVDVRDLHPSALRGAVSMVFEDTVVFTATIRENIALGRPHASDEDVRRAARLAQVEEFVAGLPDGYDTVVGEHGASLSGGQRQRLAIARAILRDPRVLILDDAMSAVDPGTDEVIRRGLVEVMRGRTTIIVAHRLETLALADRIVLLGGGRVLAEGSHAELLDLPAYRRALAIDAAPVSPVSPVAPVSP